MDCLEEYLKVFGNILNILLNCLKFGPGLKFGNNLNSSMIEKCVLCTECKDLKITLILKTVSIEYKKYGNFWWYN